MSLFSSSGIGLPKRRNREWQALTRRDEDTGRRSSHLRGLADNAAGSFHVDLLMWELESQMGAYRDAKLRKVHSSCPSDPAAPHAAPASVSYEWLRRDSPKKRDWDMPKATRRELTALCEKTKPSDLDKIRSAFVRVLTAREPPPEDVPMIFADVLRAFVDDSGAPKNNTGKLKTVLHLLGSVRRLIKPNRVEPSTYTGVPSTRDAENRLPRAEHLFAAQRAHLPCLINEENEAVDFAPALRGHLTSHRSDSRDAAEVDLELQRLGRAAWQGSKDDIQCGRSTRSDRRTSMPRETGFAAQGAASGDMAVVDLVSASSSEEALVVYTGQTCSPVRV